MARETCKQWLACVCTLLLGSSPGYAQPADEPLAAVREVFAHQYAAAEAGTGQPPAADSEELRDYVLYPYLQRARLARALRVAKESASGVDGETLQFLETHRGEPVVIGLRRAWLKSLAARGAWATFVAEYQPSGDTALHCQWLDARLRQGDEAAREEAVAQWLTAERLPPECEPLFQWLRANNLMTAELIERRARLLLANGQTGFARTIARPLAPESRAPLLQWADLLDKPAANLDALLASAESLASVDDEVLLAAWTKLARNDPEAALDRYTRLSRQLERSGREPSRYARALALGLAWDRRADDALRAFGRVARTDLDAQALAWQARAALWAHEWPLVGDTIEAMPTAERSEPRWQYWAARTAAALGDTSSATELYTAVLPSDNFYAASAAARLGRTATPHLDRLAPDETAIAALTARPGMLRARELLLCGFRTAALNEWLAAVDALDDFEKSQAVHLASRWQWHDVSVATATQQRVFYDYPLLYPRPYSQEVQSAADLTSLDSSLIYAVIRQESLFRADAVSPAGAFGLAQLLPETARIAATGLSRPAPRTIDLLDPALNVTLGAAHLRELLESFDRQTPVALAGYNAGARAAERWLPSKPIDADIWVENIPYNETRDYVQRVLWHRVVFGWLETGVGERFERWLAPIAPRTPSSPTPAG